MGLTLLALIGIIVGSIVGCILLMTLCICLCRRQQRTIITQPAYVAPVYYNPGVYQISAPTPGPAPPGVFYKAQY